MNIVNDFIRFLRFTDGIASGDIIGWILAAIAGIIAYQLIDHMQTDMERHGMLATIEDGISQIYDQQIAVSLKPDESIDKADLDSNRVMVRTVLHDFTPWQLIYEDDSAEKKLECWVVQNQRYIHIRKDADYNEWISTQALHEICLKIRRIEKMYKGRIVKKIDLSDMFREIVPLGMSGRLEFMGAYYGDYDAECIAYIVMVTIISCYKYRNYEIIKSFAMYYNAHPEIRKYFKNNRRVRPVIEFDLFKKFEKILGQRE